MRAEYSPTAGFSLVELLVAVSVLALLLATASPAVATFLERAALRGAADDVVSLIAMARSEAVKRGRNVTIAFAGSGRAWCLGANEIKTPPITAPLDGSAVCDCKRHSTCVVDGIPRVLDGADYRGVSLSSPAMPITLDARLGATSTLTENAIALSSENYLVNVQVSPLGQSRVCTPDSHTAIPGYPSC